MKIPESLKQKITKEQTKEDIDLAVERAMKWKGRPNDEVGLMTALASKDTWIDRESLEDIKSKNEAFLKTLGTPRFERDKLDTNRDRKNLRRVFKGHACRDLQCR